VLEPPPLRFRQRPDGREKPPQAPRAVLNGLLGLAPGGAGAGTAQEVSRRSDLSTVFSAMGTERTTEPKHYGHGRENSRVRGRYRWRKACWTALSRARKTGNWP
jgi:hypothetical protein